MPRISLEDNAILVERYDPVKDAELWRPAASGAKASPHLRLKRVAQLLLVPVERFIMSERREIISMYNYGDVPFFMMEDARILIPWFETSIHEGHCVSVLP